MRGRVEPLISMFLTRHFVHIVGGMCHLQHGHVQSDADEHFEDGAGAHF